MKLITQEQVFEDLVTQDRVDSAITSMMMGEALDAASQALEDMGISRVYLNEENVLCDF